MVANPPQTLNPVKLPGWDRWLASMPQADFFQTAAWARVLSEAYRFRPQYFTQGCKDRPTALLPVMVIDSWLTGKRGVSLPFTDACPHLVETAAQHQNLIDRVMHWATEHRWRSIAFRTDQRLHSPALPASRYIRHTLKIGNADHPPDRRMRKSTLRNVRRARRAGVHVTQSQTIQALRIFHRLNGLTRKRHGLPPQPWYFFEAIFAHVIAQGWGTVFLAHWQERPIAGAIFFSFGRKVYYKFGASNRAYQHCRANNLIMWTAIQHYHNAGYRSLDFGRTEMSHHGLRQFKRGWGTEEDQLYYYLFNAKQRRFVPETEASPPGYRFLKPLPIQLLRLIGHILYPHVG